MCDKWVRQDQDRAMSSRKFRKSFRQTRVFTDTDTNANRQEKRLQPWITASHSCNKLINKGHRIEFILRWEFRRRSNVQNGQRVQRLLSI